MRTKSFKTTESRKLYKYTHRLFKHGVPFSTQVKQDRYIITTLSERG